MVRVFVVLALAGCAHAYVPPELRERVVEAARHDLGLPAVGDVDWSASVLARAHAHTSRTTKEPEPGDLVLFEDGRTGVVTRAHGDLVEFLYVKAGAVRPGVLSLERPQKRRDRQGRVLNSYVRARRPDDPPGTRYLAGELVSAFAVVEPD